MLRALKRIHERIRVRKFENLDERNRRLAPMKKARIAIITFAFSVGTLVTTMLFMTPRTVDHQFYLTVVLGAFVAAALGAHLLCWSNRAGPAQDKVVLVDGIITHRPRPFGFLFGTIRALGLRVMAALLLTAWVAATVWVIWSALKMPELPPEPEPAIPVPQPAAQPDVMPQIRMLSGMVSEQAIVDGDTFDLAGSRIRPLGYDTPEAGKACESLTGPVNVYQAATQALIAFTAERVMTCEDTGERDRDGRVVATCAIDGTDLGDHMVASGWARDWPTYSRGAYCETERKARAAQIGMWGLSCSDTVWSGRDFVDPRTGEEC